MNDRKGVFPLHGEHASAGSAGYEEPGMTYRLCPPFFCSEIRKRIFS